MLVTYMAESGVPRPIDVAGRTVLEGDAPAVWFTFPDARHDIGRFHTADGTFTGWYANILTPVERLPPAADGADIWRTTDLFLDVFLTPEGAVHILDADELADALALGWIDTDMAKRAEAEAARVEAAARAGRWPPPVVRQWTAERARRAAAHSGSSRGIGSAPNHESEA